MTNLISMDKEYTTRDGRPVRLLCVDGPEPCQIIGIMGSVVRYWDSDGRYYHGGLDDSLDLIEVRTAEDVVLDALRPVHSPSAETIVAALRDAGLLKEGA